MQFTIDPTSLILDEKLMSADSKHYCLKLSVSRYEKQSFPMLLRELMRLVPF